MNWRWRNGSKTLQRNFQGYSTKGGADIYAFGMSAISQADGVYWQNLKELPGYYEALDSGWEPFAKGYILNSDDKIRRHTIMRLDVRPESGLCRTFQGPGDRLCRLFQAPNWIRMTDLEEDGLLQRETGRPGRQRGGPPFHPQHRHALRSLSGPRQGTALFQNNMKPVAIIGGGITGLTAAFCLKQRGIPVLAAAKPSERVGGVIQSVRRDGYLAEFGPNSILETSPVISDLVRDLGLESRRLYSDPSAEKRYVVRDKKPVAIPDFRGPFSDDAPVFAPRPSCAFWPSRSSRRRRRRLEESIAQFVQRRLGQEFLDYAIDPLVAGIYAGNPRLLSVSQAFPKLHRAGATLSFALFGAIPGRARTQTPRRGLQARGEEVFLRRRVAGAH